MNMMLATHEKPVGTCPHCGQRMLIRHGVKLSPKKADFFDMIANATRAGRRIPIDVLADIFYPGLPKMHARNNVKANINQTNACLEETDVVIRAGHGNSDGYRIEKRQTRKANR